MRKIYKKLMILLDKKQKKQMVGIVFLMLIGGILESLGIAMIAPVMQIVVDETKVETNTLLSGIYHGLHMTSSTQLAELIMVGLILIFIIKNLFHCVQVCPFLGRDKQAVAVQA